MKIFYPPHRLMAILLPLMFAGGAIFGVVININNDSTELVVTSLTTLAATFLGAWFAFRLQNMREKSKKHRNNIQAANRALFTLTHILNVLENVRTQVIDPVRDRPDKFLAMPPFLIQNYDNIKFDIKSLIFLLESKTPNILGELLVEEDRFHQSINSLANRSELHRHEIQPILEKAGLRLGDQFRMQDIERALGQRLFIQIQNATDNLIEHVDNTLSSTEDLIKRFVTAMKNIYPNDGFITLERHVERNN